MSAQAEELLSALENDPYLRDFVNSDFDSVSFSVKYHTKSSPKQGLSSSSTLNRNAHIGDASHMLETISANIDRIDQAIRLHVMTHEQLLLEGLMVGGVSDLSTRCEKLQLGVRELKRSLAKIKREILEPYNAALTCTTQLKNAKKTHEALRNISKMLSAVRNLKNNLQMDTEGNVSDLRDLAHSAENIRDICVVMDDGGLRGVHIVEKHREFFSAALSRIDREATRFLIGGLVSGNQADVIGSLQVFHNMDSLTDKVIQCAIRLTKEMKSIFEVAFSTDSLKGLNSNQINSSATSSQFNSKQQTAIANQNRRNKIKLHVERLFRSIYDVAEQARVLEKAFLKSHSMQVFQKNPDILNGIYNFFWEKSYAIITTELQSALNLNLANAVITEMYPFLHSGVINYFKRVKESIQTSLFEKPVNRKPNKEIRFLGGIHLIDIGYGQSDSDIELEDMPENAVAIENVLEHSEEFSQGNVKIGSSDLLSEQSRLVKAFDPLKDLFLKQSLSRLMSPVKQMFAQNDGYQVTIPSKRDLASFVNVIHTDMSYGTSAMGGNTLLVPEIMSGVSKSVHFFCTNVNALIRATSEAFKLKSANPTGGALSDSLYTDIHAQNFNSDAKSWIRTADQKHNMQLLTLLITLRSSILELPGICRLTEQGNQDTEDYASALELISSRISECLEVIDSLCNDSILVPYFSGIAFALERCIGQMHNESFISNDISEFDGKNSAYIHEFRYAIMSIYKEHMKAVADLNAPFIQEAFRKLAIRITRSLISHAALVRPIGEAGKLKMAKDMTYFESCISPIANIQMLGPANTELQAFQKLIRIDFKNSNSNAFMKEKLLLEIRPSTVNHFFVSRCPPELTSPHSSFSRSNRESNQNSDSSGREGSVGYYLDYVLRGRANSSKLKLDLLDTDISYNAEAYMWHILQQAIDRYHQRRSAAGQTGSMAGHDPDRTVQFIESCGPLLLSKYKESC